MTQNNDILKKNIFVELGLQNLPEQRKFELLNRMSDLIQKRVLLRAIKSLSVADKQAFDNLIGKNDEIAVYKFLISKVSNIDQITEQEVVVFKEEVIERIRELNL